MARPTSTPTTRSRIARSNAWWTCSAKAAATRNIGRQLYPLLREAGFDAVRVSPRMVYVDSSKPKLVDSFTRKTFAAMIEGMREPAIRAGMMSAADFDAGIRALYRSAEDDGVFCYTFFKALGEKARHP